jgi:hypothetical protein
VTLVDDLGSSFVAVKKPRYLCNPTDVNDGSPGAQLHLEHLEGYALKPILKAPLPVALHVIDAFHPSGLALTLTRASHLLVPAATSASGPPPTPATFAVDHFTCDKVIVTHGAPKFTRILGVAIKDGLGTMTVDVRKPTFLCNPTDRDGTSPGAEAHLDHLLCYQVRQVDAVKFAKATGILVEDPFGPETLDAKKPSELCVPALTAP